MQEYPLSTVIQQFQRLENVNSDVMNLFYTTTSETLAAYFSESPCIMSGIGNISNNFGQVGTTAEFNILSGAVRFPNQPTVIPDSVIDEFTWAPYSGNTITLTGITEGTTYYCVAHLTQIANDAYKVTNTMTIPTAVVTVDGLDDQNVALFAITVNTGVYSVSLDSNCAFNYGFALGGNTATGDIKYSYQTQNHLTAFGTWLICDGSTFDSVAYPNLYAVLGSTTLPDVTDRTIAMASGTHPVGTTAGANSQTVVLPQHTHGVTDPGHIHEADLSSSKDNAGPIFVGSSPIGSSNYQTRTAVTGISIQNAGTAGATMSVLQPTLYVRNAFIFAN